MLARIAHFLTTLSDDEAHSKNIINAEKLGYTAIDPLFSSSLVQRTTDYP